MKEKVLSRKRYRYEFLKNGRVMDRITVNSKEELIKSVVVMKWEEKEYQFPEVLFIGLSDFELITKMIEFCKGEGMVFENRLEDFEERFDKQKDELGM